MKFTWQQGIGLFLCALDKAQSEPQKLKLMYKTSDVIN